MARLIDDIRARGALKVPGFIERHRLDDWRTAAKHIWEILSLPDLPVILIDNVADYFYRASDQEFWDLEQHFPNLAPPFPLAWYEHKMPKTIHSKECGDSDVSHFVPNGRVGMLIVAVDPKDAVAEGEFPAGTKWILWMELFIDYGNARPRGEEMDGPHGSTFLLVDEAGASLERPWMQGFAAPEYAEQMRQYMTFLNPALLANSFLHCKNVSIVENEVPKPLARKYHARTDRWPAPYKTLVIEPLKQILRREGGSDAVGVPRAMHICRGHFSDYREGRGLFGKYHQLVWRPAMVRGTRGQARPREMEVKL